MLDLRPVGYLVGTIVAALGLSMLIPAGIAWTYGDGGTGEFLQAAFISTVTGGAIAISTIGASSRRLNIQQIFLITTLVWLVLPIFGSIPLYLMPDDLSYTDAFFEAMSGLTTTGATIYTDLDFQPRAVIFWRAMLQWFGGIGIIVVAMALLPALRVGGMQIFRTEAFDTMGKVLPRAAEISVSISAIYVLSLIHI